MELERGTTSEPNCRYYRVPLFVPSSLRRCNAWSFIEIEQNLQFADLCSVQSNPWIYLQQTSWPSFVCFGEIDMQLLLLIRLNLFVLGMRTRTAIDQARQTLECNRKAHNDINGINVSSHPAVIGNIFHSKGQFVLCLTCASHLRCCVMCRYCMLPILQCGAPRLSKMVFLRMRIAERTCCP